MQRVAGPVESVHFEGSMDNEPLFGLVPLPDPHLVPAVDLRFDDQS